MSTAKEKLDLWPKPEDIRGMDSYLYSPITECNSTYKSKDGVHNTCAKPSIRHALFQSQNGAFGLVHYCHLHAHIIPTMNGYYRDLTEDEVKQIRIARAEQILKSGVWGASHLSATQTDIERWLKEATIEFIMRK